MLFTVHATALSLILLLSGRCNAFYCACYGTTINKTPRKQLITIQEDNPEDTSSRVAPHDGRCSVGNLPGPV